jgi:prepilin-type N-terminal cleavage/methylation domain-containing protein
MNLVQQKDGFTLVELLVAIAILMIAIFAFTTLFTTSFSGIFRAGRKSEALFTAQEELDNLIAEGVSSPDMAHTIVFTNLDVEVDGEHIEIPYEYEGRSGILHYFLP